MGILSLVLFVIVPLLLIVAYATSGRGSALRVIGQSINFVIAAAATAMAVWLFQWGSKMGWRSEGGGALVVVAGMLFLGLVALSFWGLFLSSLRTPGTVEEPSSSAFRRRAASSPPTSAPAAPVGKQAPDSADARQPSLPPLPSPGPPPRSETGAIGAKAVFDRDRFFLRQRLLSLLTERYEVVGEARELLLFVERPGRIGRRLVSGLGGLVAGLLVAASFLVLGIWIGSWEIAAMGMVAAFVVAWLVRTALFVRRHTVFYRDESRQEVVFDVLQDQKLVVLRGTFTVRDHLQRPIALLQQSLLTDIWRQSWRLYGPEGRLLVTAMGDPLPRRLYLRFVSGYRTGEFVFYHADSDIILGRLTRRVSLEDRYVLDVTSDRRKLIDRRLAIALAVMIDSLESGGGRP